MDSEQDFKEIIENAYLTYRRYYLRAVLLDIFGKYRSLEDSEIKDYLFKEIEKEQEIFWSATMADIIKEYEYICYVDYVALTKGEKKIEITEHGLKALREGALHNLSTAAFVGYKTLFLGANALEVSEDALAVSERALGVSDNALAISKQALFYSKIAAIGSVIAVLFAIISLAVALFELDIFCN